jgi:hypothetical protein
MRSCWSGENDQLVVGVDVTVVVRWLPGLPARCGTRVARPLRTTVLEAYGDDRSLTGGRGRLE